MSLRVGLIGFGTVGSGVVKTLAQYPDLITTRAGTDIVLTHIADLDWETDRGVDVSHAVKTTDAWELIRNPEIDVIVELIGGTTIARDFVLEAMKNGKDVVTANKALLAAGGEELFQTADTLERKIHFEGAVGGGIPIIQSLDSGLASVKITEIHAIINGTSNYILTDMEVNGKSFKQSLNQAQKLGYAELDPTYDVDGIDAAHKITILASMCFDTSVKLDEVYTQGMRDITVEDIEFGRKLGYCLKVLAIAKDLGNEIEVRVHPTFIPQRHLLASVNGVFNAVNTYAKGMGSTILYGRGAGDMPTGHAVVSDLIQCAKDSFARRKASFDNFYTQRKKMRSMNDVIAEYYLRFMALDQPGILAKIAGVLGEHNISIHSVLQTERNKDDFCPVVIITHLAREGDIKHALGQIQKLEIVKVPVKVIRIEQLDANKG